MGLKLRFVKAFARRAFRVCLFGGTLFALVSASAPRLFASGLNQVEQSVKSLGAGGAYVSIADDSSAFFLNPAGIARHSEQRRVFLRNHQVVTKRADGSKNAKQWNLSAGYTDGVTENPLHFGFSFNTLHTDARALETYTLGLGYSFRDLVLIGLVNNFTNFNSAELTPNRWTYDLKAGILIFPFEFLAIGVSAKNLVRSKKDNLHLPVTFAGGASLNLKDFRLGADLERNHSASQLFFRAGAEYRILEFAQIRAGFYVEKDQEILGYTMGSSILLFNGLELQTAFEDQLKSPNMTFSGGVQVRF